MFFLRCIIVPFAIVVLVNAASANTFSKVHTASDAIGWAIADLLQQQESDRLFQRYLWLPPWQDKWSPAIVVALNTAASRSARRYIPRIEANGYLLCVDMRRLAPDKDDLGELITLWDSLAEDEPYARIPQANLKDGDGLAVLSPHISAVHADLLNRINYSPSLVYRADWFLVKLLDEKYYEFMGWVKTDGTLQTQNEIFADVGIDEWQTRSLNGDIRKATRQSQVTGQQRRVDVFNGLGGRYNDGRVFMTRDVETDVNDVAKLPLSNLLRFVNGAREIIFERANGTHGYFITDGQGNLVRVAANNVVSDTTVPDPYPKQLKAGISCIRCHGAADGLHPVRSDIAKLLNSGMQVDYDLSGVNLPRQEALERVYGLYSDPSIFDKKIARGRDDLSDTVFVLSGGMKTSEAYQKISEIYNEYMYKLVEPKRAMMALGFIAESDKSQGLFNRLMGEGAQREDVTIALLRAGISVRRTEWERVYFSAAMRASKYGEQLVNEDSNGR